MTTRTARFYLLMLALFIWTFVAMRATAELTCPTCYGVAADMMIALDTVSACVPAAQSPTATVLQYQLEYDDGTTVTQAGDENCRIDVALYPNNRVRLRARFCNIGDCGPWSGWGGYASRLVPECPGDLDHNGVVDGFDFMLFRGAFLDPACP